MKRVLIVVSIIMLIITCILILNRPSKSIVTLDSVNLKNDEVKKGLAVMVEQSDGTYAESNTYPTRNYMLNENKSGCIDKHGKAIANSISYKNGTVTFKTNRSSYCYVYFDRLTLVKYLLNEDTRPSSLWTSTLDGDGYRFVGTDPSNYLCFGIEDKDTCIGNTDLYMYRIIGIFEDESGKKYVKLIKKEALNTAYKWQASYSTNTKWENSAVYSVLNGKNFLNNTTYSYMQNTIWLSKIKDWTWSAVNTQTESHSGLYYYASAGTGGSGNVIFYHEMNHPNKTSAVGEWTTPVAKIGLLYASDFLLAASDGLWLSLVNNDSATLSTTGLEPPAVDEWSMARYGMNDGYGYEAYYLANSIVYHALADRAKSVRPVFYLVSNEEYLSGTGSKTDPFMLNGRPKYTVSVTSNNTSFGGISVPSLSVYEGDKATIEIVPEPNYKYSSNTCGGTVSDNILTISNVTSNIDCTVTFVEKPKYTVSVTSNNTSYGTVSPATQTVYEGNSATITLSPKTGYVYESNDCGGVVSGNSMIVNNVNGNKNCQVVFKKSFAGYLIDTSTRPASLWKSTLTGDGYRFVGSNPSNYICFGTTDKDTCVASSSTYMYRIIGVFSNKYVKLIKSSRLGSYAWHSTKTSNATWGNSSLFTGLNGSYFLTNTTYSYMQDATWTDKISNWTWSALQTNSWPNGVIDTSLDLQYMTARNIYYQEMNHANKPNSTGSWTKPKAKIGIMYASDFLLSSGESELDSTANTSEAFNKGWMRISSSEWTMSRIGSRGGSYYDSYYIWYTSSDNEYIVSSAYAHNGYSVRPVFYLAPTVEYISGTGTSTDPYIIS